MKHEQVLVITLRYYFSYHGCVSPSYYLKKPLKIQFVKNKLKLIDNSLENIFPNILFEF